MTWGQLGAWYVICVQRHLVCNSSMVDWVTSDLVLANSILINPLISSGCLATWLLFSKNVARAAKSSSCCCCTRMTRILNGVLDWAALRHHVDWTLQGPAIGRWASLLTGVGNIQMVITAFRPRRQHLSSGLQPWMKFGAEHATFFVYTGKHLNWWC